MAFSTKYHVFSLPPELLDALIPRHIPSNQSSSTQETVESQDSPLAPANASSRSCGTCLGTSFNDIEQQRAHFRSDWHRYNVNTRLNGGTPVGEGEFTRLAEESESSSDSDGLPSDYSTSEAEDRVASLVKRGKQPERSNSPDVEATQAPRTALTWFHLPPSTQFGIYKSIFSLETPEAQYLRYLRDMQTPVEGGRTWAMFMVAGGHFAGAIVRVSEDPDEELSPKALKQKKYKQSQPATEVLLHKTFHRYTTRRKQGGSQSMNDNAKGNAKSAGALLRRYGEQALRDDIRNLIRDWSEELDRCERIWIRASRSNRKIFMDYDGCSIAKTDERLRTFPFPTKRPTQNEVVRCLLELTQVKSTHFTEGELKAQDEAYIASLPKPKVAPVKNVPTNEEKPKVAKLSKEEEMLRSKWDRLLEMITKGRIEPLKLFWKREGAALGGVDTVIPEWTEEKGKRSLLQIAAIAGKEEVVTWLLEECRADPMIEELTSADEADTFSGKRRTAYDLAKTKGVRDVFRRCAAEHPDWWDWFGAANVPSALSKDKEDAKDEKKKIRRKGLKDKVRDREAREKEQVAEVEPSPAPPIVPEEPSDVTGPRKLGGGSRASDGVSGLTPEMQAKVERERRARAAEARLKALGGR